MRLVSLVLALSLLGLASALVAPTADARGFCSSTIDSWCEGELCLYEDRAWTCYPRDLIVCIREPCPIGPEP